MLVGRWIVVTFCGNGLQLVNFTHVSALHEVKCWIRNEIRNMNKREECQSVQSKTYQNLYTELCCKILEKLIIFCYLMRFGMSWKLLKQKINFLRTSTTYKTDEGWQTFTKSVEARKIWKIHIDPLTARIYFFNRQK